MKKILLSKRFLLIGLFFLLLSLGNMAIGQVRTAIVSGNWSDPLIWVPQVVPTNTEDIVINAGISVVMDVPGTCRTIIDIAGGGSIVGAFSLTIDGNAGIAIDNISGISTISCPLILPATASISVSGNLTISGVIDGAAVDLLKNGPGKLVFTRANLYTGYTTVNAGILNLQDGQAAGSAVKGTIVNNSAQLELESLMMMFIGEPLDLTGSGIASGALYNVSGTSIITGAITINGTDTWINSAGGDILITSAIDLKSNTLTFQGASDTYVAGNISSSFGTGDIVKEGTGELSFVNQFITINSLSIHAGIFTSTSETLILSGNFVNNAVFNHNGGTVTLNGSSAQSIGGSQEATFNNLNLNNSSGALLGNSQIVEGTLTLANGSLTLGNFNITLGLAAVGGSPSASNMIITDGTGECRRVFEGIGSYVFPVGDNTGIPEYSPVTLDFTSGTFSSAYASVRVADGMHPENTSAADYLTRFWTVSQSGISSYLYNFSGTFANSASDINGDIANILSGIWTGAAWQNYSPVTAPVVSATGVSGPGAFTGISTVTTLVPGITLGASASVCSGLVSAGLPYTATINSPDQYSVTWDAAAITAGFTDVPVTALPVSPITIPVPPGASVDAYTGTIKVYNSVLGSSSAGIDFTVQVNSIPTAVITNQINVNCYGNSNGSINISVSGGTSGYSFSWTRDGSAIAAASEDLSGLVAGTYIVTVSDANGCESQATVNITQPDALGLVLTPTNASCFGGNMLVSAAISSTPLSDLQISIDGGAFANVAASPVVFNGLSAGNHTLILRRISDNSCSITKNVSVTQPDALGLVLTPTNANCFGGNMSVSAALSGTLLSDLQISIDGGAFANIAANPVVFNGLSAGSHTLILRRISDNSCSITKNVSVTQPDALGLVLTPTNATCFGGNMSVSAAISGTPLNDLQISFDGGVFANVAGNPVVFNGLSAGSHTLILRRISDNSCLITESVTVSQPDALTAGTTSSDQTICFNTNPLTLTGLTSASGGVGGYTYQWQSSATGAAPWVIISGATSDSYTPGILTASTWYRRAVTSGSCGTAYSTGVKITVNPDLSAGTTGSNQNICYNSSPAGLTQLTAPAGGTGVYTFQWQSSVDNLSWGDISGATSGTYSPGNITSTVWFRRVVTSGSCGTVQGNSTKITVYDILNGGLIGSDQAICYNTLPASFTNDGNPSGGTGLSYQWQQKAGAGAWTAIAGATGLSYTVVSNLTQTTLYRRSVLSASGCGTGYSNEITVTVYPAVTAGTIGPAQTICYNSGPAELTELAVASGGTGSYTYQWQSSPTGAAPWTIIPGATSGTYTPGILTASTWYRRVVTSGSCGTANGTGVKITVNPDFTAGTTGSNQNICYNSSPAGLTQLTAPAGGTGVYTFQWQSSVDNITWDDISGATSGTYSPGNLTSNVWYRRMVTSGSCGTVSGNSIKITVYDALIPGSIGSDQSICYNSQPVAFINENSPSGGTGLTYQWQYKVGAGAWTAIAGATGLSYTVVSNLTQTTLYRRSVLSSSGCGTAYSNEITVAVYPAITAGTPGSSQTLCYNTIPDRITELAAATGGTGSYTYQWQSSNNNSTWTNIADSISATFAPGALLSTIYYRRIVTSGSCGSATSTSVLLTVRPNLSAPVAFGNRTICYNTAPLSLSAAAATGGNGTFSYQWQLSTDNLVWADIAGATNYTVYAPGTLTATAYYRLVATATGVPACGTVFSNVIKITVLPELMSPIASADQTICYNSAPAQLTSTPATGGNETFSYQWYSSLNNSTWSMIGGATGVSYQPSTLTASTYYHVVATTTGSPACGSKTSNPILISVYPNVTAGSIGVAQTICYNTSPAGLTELAAATGGNGSYTYQWQSSPNNSVWTTITDSTSATFAPGILSSSIYYRRIVTSGICGSATSTGILITVRPNLIAPVASGSRTICYNTVPASLSATAATGGSGTFSYQWQSSPDNSVWTDISGATSYSTYTPAALTFTTFYRLVATATGAVACGTINSNVVTITILPELNSPVVTVDQTICYNSVPAQLISTPASGGNGTFSYQWYSSLNNSTWSIISGATGLLYQPSALTASTYYRIVATNTGTPSCGSKTSNPVLVTVNAITTAGTIGSAQTICYNTTPARLTEITPASGGTGTYTYQWQSSLNNITWTNISDSISETFSPGVLVANIFFRRVAVSAACGSANTPGILITVRPNIAAPIASGTRTICYNTVSPALTSTTASGGTGTFTYQWQSSPDNSVWTDISGATSYNSYTPPALTSTTFFRLEATATGIPACGMVMSNVITITVLPELISPVLSADQTICYSSAPVQLTSTTASGGNETFSYQWYSSLNNLTWSIIGGATGLTYQPSTLTTSTYYHIIASTTGLPACGSKISNSVLITVYPAITPGIIGTAQTICYNTIPVGITELATATGGNGSYTYQWQSSPNNSIWTNITDSISRTYNPEAMVAGIFYRRVVTSGSCGSANSAGILISVRPDLTAPVASASRTICYNSIPAPLTSTTAAGGSGTFNYQWQKSADNIIWTTIAGATNYSSYAPPPLTSTTYFRLAATATGIPSCGAIISNVITIMVLPELISPVVTADQAICYNTAPLQLNATTASGGNETFSYQWYSSLNNSTWSIISGATALSYQPSALTTSTYYHIVATTTGANSCGSIASNPVMIIVKPYPVVFATPAAQTICSAATTSIALTSPVSGTTFSWTAVQADVSGATPGSGSSIAQTLSATGTISGTATYTIVPAANGCDGAVKTVIISVRPIPVAIAIPASQTRCSGVSTSIALASNVPSTSYAWTVVQTNVSGASAGSGSAIIQTLTATGTTPGTATYSIIPTANGCSGASISLIVTVNPSPVAVLTPASQIICSGTATSISLSSTIAGTTFSWTAAQSGVTGATSASGTTISQTLTPAGTIAGIATFTITPTANGCAGSAKTAVVTVNPIPVATATPSAQTICSGSASAVVLTSPVAGTTFNRTYDVTPSGSITGASDGPGNLIAQTLVNTTLSQASVKYTVIPTSNSCSGNALDIIVTVNPIATLSSPLIASVCSNSLFSYTPASVTPLTTFSWTRAAELGIQNAANSGTGSIAETLINTTGIAKTVTYVYTLISYSCTTVQSVFVTVNPTPALSSSLTPPAVCSNSAFTYAAVSSVTGSTITWARALVAGISNPPGSGTGNINETLINTTAADIVVPYVYSLSVGSCTSTFTVNSTIKPTPTVIVPANMAYCNGDNIPTIVFTGSVSGTTYSWGNSNTAIGLAANGSGSIVSFTAVNSTSALISATISVGPAANGCSGVNSGFSISVYPESQGGTVNSDASVCGGANAGTLTLSGHTGSVTKWQSSTDGGANWTDISNTTTSHVYTNLVQTTHFRAAVQSGICLPEYSSVATITMVQPSVGGMVSADATVCSGINSGTLTLSGETGGIIKWQFSINGGTSWIDISNTSSTQSYTNLTVNTLYRVVVQNGACMAMSSSSAAITVNPASFGGSVSGGTTICSGSTSGLLSLSGQTGIVSKWQYSVNPFTIWNDIANTGASYTSGVLSQTTQFRAVVNSGVCGPANSAATMVIVDPTSAGGSVDGGTTICSGNTSGLLTLSGYTGSITKWQYSISPFLTWTDIANTASTFTSGVLTQTTQFRAVISSGVCSAAFSTSATVTVSPASTGGTVAGGSTICSGTTSGLLTLTGQVGTVNKWQYSVSPFTAWTDIANTALTYTSGVLTQNTQFRAVITSGACSSVNSAVTTVSVDPLSDGGSVTGGTAICSGSTSGLLTLSGHTGTVTKWQYSVSPFSSWTDIANTAATYTSGALTQTTQYRAVVASGVCSPANSLITTVTVSPPSAGGSVAGGTTICSGSTSGLLTLSGHTGTITKWQYSVSPFSTWTDIANTATTYTSGALTQTTRFRVVVTSGVCGPVNSGSTTVTVAPVPVLVITDPPLICTPGKVNLTVASVTAGSTAGLTLTYWIDAAATTPYATPTAADNDTYYIKGTTAAGCYDIKPVNASIYATIGIPVFALGATSVICNSSAPKLYNASAANAATLTYTIDAASIAGGNSINASTGMLTFASAYTGNITITATASGCGVATAIHVVTVNPAPSIALTASSASVCVGASVTLTAANSGGIDQLIYSGTAAPNLTIPNNSNGSYTYSTINLSAGAARLTTSDIVIVTINSITHARDNELDIFLVDPDGTRAILLSSDNGGTGANYTNTELRTDALNVIGTAGNNTAPLTGSYRPEGTISTAPDRTGATGGGDYTAVVPGNALNSSTGAPITGNWSLRVFDDNNNNNTAGRLVSWSLSIIKQTVTSYTSVVNGNPAIGAVSYTGASNSTATSVVTPPVGSNVYTVTTTSSNGCSATSNDVTIVVNPLPVPVITADYCTYRPKVRLTTGTYSSYLWNTGATTQFIDVDIAGAYSVSVTSASGCTGTTSIQVADELATNGNFSAGNIGFVTPGCPQCYGYVADIAGNSELNPEGLYGVGADAHNYHSNFWGPGRGGVGDNFMIVNGFPGTPQPVVWQQTITGLTVGTTYYFAAWARSVNSAGNGANLKFSINGTQIGVPTGALPDLAANAGPYTWTRFYGNWAATSTTAILEIVDLTFATGGNDFGIDDISFGSLASVPFAVTASSNSPAISPLCSRSTLQLTSAVTGGKMPIVYSWTGPNSFTSNVANPVINSVSPTAGGSYTVSVVDAYNCPGVTATTVVAINPTPEIPNKTADICSSSAFNATPVNGVTDAGTFVPANTVYTWAAPVVTGGLTGGTSGTGSASITGTLSNPTTSVQTATYTITPFTYTGTPATPKCTGTPFTLVVTVYPTATVSAGANRTVCADAPSVTLAGSYGGAATSATWAGGTTANFNPNRNSPTAVYTPSAAEITAGTVTLTLTTNDPAGPCAAATASMTITIGALPVLSTVVTQVKCYGDATGAINLTVTGGGASPAYLWKRSNGTTVATTEDLAGLVADTYTVVVTGTNGCTRTASVIITQPAAALSASAVVTGMLCAGGSTGTITLTVSGGTANYTYLWTASAGGVVPAGQSAGKNLTGLVSGTYSVTVTDANTCTVSLSKTVTVAANTTPVITSCPVSRNFNGCSTASITGPVFSSVSANSTYAVFSNASNLGVATDNCAITTVTYQDVTSTTCPIVVTRSWTLGDAGGLTVVCQQTITVTDVVAPSWTTAATALNRTVECSDATGLAAAFALSPAASDVCDADVSDIVKTTGLFVVSAGCSQEGTYTNTWTVTDECGNQSSAYTQVITITDNTAPLWITPVGSLNRTMECSDVLALAAARVLSPTASDLCDANVTNIVKISGVFVAGSCGNKGTYTNRWTVADDCGNISNVFTQVITITDNTAPVWLSVPGEINRTVECNNVAGLLAAQSLSPSASDNCTANVTSVIKTNGTFVPSAGCAQEGSYTNTWTVSDGCGNTSVVYVQVIDIVDNAGPIINCPASNAFSCDSPSFNPSITGTATVIDNCDTNPAVTWADVIVPGACAGNYQILRTWTAVDACGQSNSCEQTIFVQDVEAPVITCAVSGNQDVYPDPAVAYIVPGSLWDASATDNCSGVTLSVVLSGATVSGPHSTLQGVAFSEGITNVTWSAVDGCGISSECQFTVTVTFKPEISCRANINHNTDSDLCSANLDPGFPALAIGSAPIVYSWAMSGATTGSGTGPIGFYTFNSGLTTITWTATNSAGSGLCSQTITVVDNQPPDFSVPIDKEYCVSDIYQAEFFAPTVDIIPVRPDYYIFTSGNTDLDLNPATFIDNCSTVCTYEIRWRIDFQDGTIIPELPDTYITGQPSEYGLDFSLPGNPVLDVIHHITYQVVDCSGNVSDSQTVKITIKPRPDVIKVTNH